MMIAQFRKKLTTTSGKDVVWTFSIQIVIMLGAFAVNKLLASRLSIDEFGQYNVIKRSVQVLSFVMLAGAGIALPRYIPLYRNAEIRRPVMPLVYASLIYIIGVTLLTVIVCLIFSDQLQLLIIGQCSDTSLYLIALAYAFTLAIAQFAYAYYRGMGDFKWYNGSQLAVQLLIIMPLFLFPTLTVFRVFISWLIVTTLLVAFYLARELWIRERLSESFRWYQVKGELAVIVTYASGRLLADFFLFSLSAFPLIYISNVHGFQTTAYYSVGLTFVTMVTPLFSFMGIILLPYVSKAIARRELQSANRFIGQLTLIYIVSSLLIIVTLYVFIYWLTLIFFSENYVAAGHLSRIMLLSILPQSLYLLYRNPIDAISVVPYNTIILGVCLVAMILLFLHADSVEQQAWAYLAVSTLQGGLSWLAWVLLKRSLNH